MRVYVLYFVHGDEDFGGGEQPSELRTGFGDIFGPGGWNWLESKGCAIEGEGRKYGHGGMLPFIVSGVVSP